MTAQGLEQWDLTSKNASYLDRHMMFPLLEYLDGLIESDKISYSSKDVAAARLSLLRPTHMVDYAIDIYKSVHGDSAEIPEEMQAQKTEVFKQLEELQAGCKPLTEICDNEEEKVSPLRLSSLYLSIPLIVGGTPNAFRSLPFLTTICFAHSNHRPSLYRVESGTLLRCPRSTLVLHRRSWKPTAKPQSFSLNAVITNERGIC